MSIKDKHEQFMYKFKNANPELFERVEVLGTYEDRDIKILMKDKYGEFKMSPRVLFRGCNPMIKSATDSTQRFISIANEKYNNKFDYSKTTYVKAGEKVIIICPIHGEFKQTPNGHLSKNESKQGCTKCGHQYGNSQSASTKDEFVDECSKIHNNKYDYSKVVYKNCDTKVEIICPLHGSFLKTPYNHRNLGIGCDKCSRAGRIYKNKSNKDEFIKRASLIHGNRYNYSKVEYINNETPVTIICEDHGEFLQKPTKHINAKQNCPTCSNELRGWDFTLWERRASLSGNFKGYVLYKIKCFNSEEEFYKIGITYQDVKTRFESNKMPYSYELIEIIENDSAEYIWNLEKYLHRLHKKAGLHYSPKIEFGGHTECFTELL